MVLRHTFSMDCISRFVWPRSYLSSYYHHLSLNQRSDWFPLQHQSGNINNISYHGKEGTHETFIIISIYYLDSIWFGKFFENRQNKSLSKSKSLATFCNFHKKKWRACSHIMGFGLEIFENVMSTLFHYHAIVKRLSVVKGPLFYIFSSRSKKLNANNLRITLGCI